MTREIIASAGSHQTEPAMTKTRQEAPTVLSRDYPAEVVIGVLAQIDAWLASASTGALPP